jgi:ELWxxDGT repeat protein
MNPRKPILTISLILMLLSNSYTQISPFADLNLTDKSSFPSSFTEYNNATYFISVNGLCRIGAGNSQIQVIDSQKVLGQNLIYKEHFKYLYVFGTELYYFKTNVTTTQLWKTDGTTNQMVLSNFPIDYNYTKLFFINNSICYFSENKLYKIENNSSILLGTFPHNLQSTNYNPIGLPNALIFYTFETNNLKIWKSDGTAAETTLIGNISGFDTYQIESGTIANSRCVLLNNEVYFFVPKVANYGNYSLELWKTDGASITFIKVVLNPGNGYVFNLASKNGKILFNYGYTQLWMSDGTASGTSMIKSFSHIALEYSNRKWGYFNGFYYFGAKETTNFELWKTDGTTAGTSKVYDYGASTLGDRTPTYFYETNTELFFIVDILKLWKTDGTTAGTSEFTQYANPNETDQIGYFYPFYPEIYKNPSNQYLWRNWDAQNGHELWRSNTTLENSVIVSNATINTNKSLISDIKHKIGNTWYFNGINEKGAELWKTDGTLQGTTMVKDINQGFSNTYILGMTSMNNILYFIASNAGGKRGFYRSDGTEAGTYEVAPNLDDYQIKSEIVTDGNKIYFVAASATGQYTGFIPWASDGTAAGTYPIPFPLGNGSIPPEDAKSLTIANNKLFFIAYSRIWSGNSNQVNPIYLDYINRPYFPNNLIEFNQKVYTLCRIYDPNAPDYPNALYETDGTEQGSRIVKSFPSESLYNSIAFYLSKSNDKIYFREISELNTYPYKVNLWCSDGTTAGTIKLKEIGNTNNLSSLRSKSIGNNLVLFTGFLSYGDSIKVWRSDGTVAGTNKIFGQKSTISEVIGIGGNQTKMFFTCVDNNQNFEFWETNGTTNGTIRRGTNTQFQPLSSSILGPNSPKSDNIMDFNQKMMFWSYDTQTDYEPWIYQLPDCQNNINYTLKSGDWNDLSSWSCGFVPTLNQTAIIKNPHKITISATDRININKLITEAGCVLQTHSGAVFEVRN